MKYFKLFILSTTCFLLLACASFKNQGLESFYEEYPEEKTSMRIPKFLLMLGGDYQEIKPLLKKLKAARIVVYENMTSHMQKKLDKALKHDNYEEYLTIKNEEDVFTIYAVEKNNKIVNIVIKAKDEQDLSLIQTRVNLPLNEFTDLISNLN